MSFLIYLTRVINIKNTIKNMLLFDNNTIKITFTPNKLHIINYDEIKSFEDNKIIITYDNHKLIIKGKNLITKKLLDREVLVEGVLELIELG